MSDEDGIRRTIAAYPQLVDDGRFLEVAALYAADGAHVSRGRTLLGRVAIRDFLASLPLRDVRHLNGSPLIAADGDRAVATTEWTAYEVASGKPSLLAGGRYHDRLVRVDGRWFFAERRNVWWSED